MKRPNLKATVSKPIQVDFNRIEPAAKMHNTENIKDMAQSVVEPVLNDIPQWSGRLIDSFLPIITKLGLAVVVDPTSIGNIEEEDLMEELLHHEGWDKSEQTSYLETKGLMSELEISSDVPYMRWNDLYNVNADKDRYDVIWGISSGPPWRFADQMASMLSRANVEEYGKQSRKRLIASFLKAMK